MNKENILLILEIICLIIGFLMVIIGLVQPKKSQSGLGALSGGNQELFSQSKERGLERTLSLIMLFLGTSVLVIALILQILQRVLY